MHCMYLCTITNISLLTTAFIITSYPRTVVGVQHGDPLGPLLFCLLLQKWYLLKQLAQYVLKLLLCQSLAPEGLHYYDNDVHKNFSDH